MAKEVTASAQKLGALGDELERALSGLSELELGEKQRKGEDIRRMISHYLRLTETMEDRRVRIYNLSLQVLAISLAGSALLLAHREALVRFLLGFVFLSASSGVLALFFVASIATGLFYQCQSAFRYPFVQCPELEEYGNRWKWFYYGNKEILKINTRSVFRTSDPNKTAVPYLAGLRDFVSNYSRETFDAQLRDSVIQLYLYQVHNYYKNRWYLRLTSIWRFTFFAALAWLAVGIIYGVRCFN